MRPSGLSIMEAVRWVASRAAWLLILGIIVILWQTPGVGAQDGADPFAQMKLLAWGNAVEYPPLFTQSAFAPSSVIPKGDGQTPANSETEGLWNQIAFQSFRDGNWEIYLMNHDGSDQRRLTHHSASDVAPRLRPDLEEVVFTSYRDGDAQIYKMRTDGSDLQRLTNTGHEAAYPSWAPDGHRLAFSQKKKGHWAIYRMDLSSLDLWRMTDPGDADDISPVWSPNGSKIAWIRRKAHGYGDVMIMDAYGGNQRLFRSNLKFVQNLVWSPDGSHLAVDYDYGGDNWNDLVIFNMNGRREVVRRSPGSLIDLWLGSWSPDSNYLLYTQVKYVVQDNKLYIAEARLKKIKAEYYARNPSGFPGSGLDMAPDWQQGVDNWPPIVSIDPLPAISPSPIHVSWSGEDEGLAGLDYFEVQVREGGGDWQDWLQTTELGGMYAGVGGHHYAFRVRARDKIGNLSDWTAPTATTVEEIPPHTVFTHLPRYLRNNSAIAWLGEDEGGSGVKTYDVQYREAPDEQWQDLRTQTTDTHAVFSSDSVGQSYFFRVRAVDNAGNQETWDDVGQGPVTIYHWGVTGAVHDNRGRPLAGAEIVSAPAAWLANPSDENGNYALYVNASAGSYKIDWSFPGFPSPPTTTYPASVDAHTDVAMPPLDDVIQDGVFETTDTSPWQTTGRYPPQKTDLFHTGLGGMQVGKQVSFDDSKRIETPHDAYHLLMKKDNQDNLHLLWDDRRDFSDYVLMYAKINADGSVAEVREFEAYGVNGGGRSMSIAPDGLVYIVWLSPSAAYNYALVRRSPDGQWSEPQILDVGKSGIVTATDAQGILHLYVRDGEYLQCTPTGICSPPEETGVWDNDYWGQNMTVTPDGTAYFTWLAYYRVRHPDGRWDDRKRLPGLSELVNVYSPAYLIVDDQGVMYSLLDAIEDHQASMVYTRLEPNGRWWQKRFPRGKYSYFLTPDGRVHIIGALGQYGNLSFRYARQEPDGRWSIDEEQKIPAEVAEHVFHADRYQFTVDSQGRIYAAGFGNKFYVALRDMDNRWHYWNPFGKSCSVYVYYEHERSAQLLTDSDDMLQIVWPGDYPHCDVFYATPAATESGDSLLRQQVRIPSDMNDPALSFFYRFDKGPNSPSRLELSIEAGGQTTPLLITDQATDDWAHRWLDVTPWAGQTVTITFNVPQTSGAYSGWAEVDDVSLGASAYPDLWVSAPAVTPRANDAHIAFSLFYGNRGDAPGKDARIIFTLPESTSFVNANPSPSGQEDDRVWWDVAELFSDTDATAIQVITTMPAEATAGDVFAATLDIITSSLEINKDNNTADVAVFIDGVRQYLPLSYR